MAPQSTGTWSTLCAASGYQPDVWCGDHYRGRYARGRAMLLDVSRYGHQRAAAHTSMEAAPLDRALFPHPKAPAGDWGLPRAQRGRVLWPSGLMPDGLPGVVLHLAGHL